MLASGLDSLESDPLLADDDSIKQEKSFIDSDLMAEAQEHAWTIGGIISLNCAIIGLAAMEASWGFGVSAKAVEQVFPDEKKGMYSSVFYSCKLVLTLSIPLIFAVLLDKYLWRKRVVLFSGMLVMLAGLVLFYFFGTKSVAGFLIPYLVIVLGDILFDTAFNPVLGSNFATERQGLVSGLIGSLTMVGYLIGALILLAFARGSPATGFALICAFLCVTAIPTIYCAHDGHLQFEPTCPAGETQSEIIGDRSVFRTLFYPALKSSEFRWVVSNRCFTRLGVSVLWQFTWLWDENRSTNMTDPTQYYSSFSMIIFVACSLACCISLIVGVFKDKGVLNHKYSVALADTIMGLCMVLLIFVELNGWHLVVMSVFGLAYGVFIGLEFSMICTVLPTDSNLASSFALWEIGTLVPVLIFEPILGVSYDALHKYGAENNLPTLGSSFLFGFGALMLFAGALSSLTFHH